MADNTQLPISQTAGDLIATDDIGGVKFQRIKMIIGADGVNDGDISASNPMPISAPSSLPLPEGAATETTLATLLTTTAFNTRTPVYGQALMAASTPVVIASDQSAIPTIEPATVIVGQAAQTAIINNILPATASASATATDNLRSAAVQIVSTGTGGTYIFEQSNDNINFRPLPVFNAELTTGVAIVSAITATASQIIYTFPIRARFTRLRIVSTITGGSIQAFSRLSSDPWTSTANTVSNPTAANLQATVTGVVTVASTTLSSGTLTSANLGIPSIIADVASAALATTTTTAAITPTFGTTYIIDIPVILVTGTTPTLDIVVQESTDSGTNWFDVYHFPRITATGSFRSPPLTLRGNRVRYVQTVGGTTPSFTRAVNRPQRSEGAPIRTQFVDRTIVPNTINSISLTYYVEGCKDFTVYIRCTAQTTPATIFLQTSHDGLNWVNVGTGISTIAGFAIQKYTNELNKFARLGVSAGGTGITLGEAVIVGVGA